jgi:serine/threonine-protein kinase
MLSNAQALLAFLRDREIVASPLPAWWDQLPREHPKVEGLVEELRRRGQLTPLQVEFILGNNLAGLLLGKFVLLERLGKGGMGEVYKARNPQLNKLVALKTIRTDRLVRPDDVLRFQREARSAARLDHPNIVRIFDIYDYPQGQFIAMELVEGMSLSRVLKTRGPLSVPLACQYGCQVALALQHAHEKNVVHRDIKPANLVILKTPAADGVTLKVLDFGLARCVGDAGEHELTTSGQWVGTPDFIAPEQACDSKNVDIRADIFSLGCVLYHAMTGKSAYPGSSVAEKLAARISGPAQPIHLVRPDVPSGLADILARMLAREPQWRYGRPLEVAQALEPFADLVLAGQGKDEKRLGQREAFSSPATIQMPSPDHASPYSGALLSESGAKSTRHRAEITVPPQPADVDANAPTEPTSAPAHEPLTQSFTPLLDPAAAPPHPLATSLGNPGKDRRMLALGGMAAAVALLMFLWQPWSSHRPKLVLTPLQPVLQGKGKETPGPRTMINSLGMKLVEIQAGKFRMGAAKEEDGPDWEYPQHEARIEQPFWLGAHEVTQGEFLAVMGVNPSHFRAGGPGAAQFNLGDTDRFPVEKVSWEMAQQFCRNLSNQEAEKKAGRVYRLPTEAEWEYACRAGSTSPFHFGPTLSSQEANCKGNKMADEALRMHPLPVGSFSPNAFGLHDMHGNVMEWCQDRFQPYADLLNKALLPAERDDRVLRGGAYGFQARECRSAARLFREPGLTAPYAGFRVACWGAEQGVK